MNNGPIPDQSGQQPAADLVDRRQHWTPAPRPEWLAKFNSLGDKLDIKAIVPLDEASLIDAAVKRTGLTDFDDADGWREHFRVLLDATEKEAQLNFFGRILTRSDFLNYLSMRLTLTDQYRRFPEIENEVITEPVFILGFGRSGTTILHETLGQDPQFRSVRRWEALFPVPPPEEATYETDPRIAKARDLVDVVHAISPEFEAMHAWGADLPVEDIEFTYAAFFSEVWENALQIPTYNRYFHERSPDYHFYWHKRMLKLLQWKYKKPHWLFKNPTHMSRIPSLLKAYPDAKIIFPHRDPVVTADSVVNVSGAIFYWRTDHPYAYEETGSGWVDIEPRVQKWEDIIGMIESGALRPGYFANSIYPEFLEHPQKVITDIYRDLRLTLTPEALAKMLAFLDERHSGTHGNSSTYDRSRATDPRTIEERKRYARYQKYFNVPYEI
jgi:hypothetical protein